MIDSIFKLQYTIAKHTQAPFLHEREVYLQYLSALGKRRPQLQNISMELLHVIRVMEIKDLRKVDEAEIRVAAERWAREEDPRRTTRGNKSSAARFRLTARGWFRFHGLLTQAPIPSCCFDFALNDFVVAMHSRLTSETLRVYVPRAKTFLTWAATRHDKLSSISLRDIDEFLESKRHCGWRPKTLRAVCQAIRTFLHYAESRGWSKPGMAEGVHNPVTRNRSSRVTGPCWKDVRRMIKDCEGSSWADYRAKPILLLCSIYGLRNSEVVRLSLDDFDWRNETFTVKRAKNGRTQQFPIQYEIGEAIIRYLQNARPQCHCRQLFISQHPPYRPLKSVGPAVNRRMKRLGIKSHNLGPHSLRHACATELLRRGTPLRDIANFLGHRDIDSVSVYAKHDVRALRAVAKFSLVGVR